MTTHTIDRPVERPAADLEALFPGRYLSVTSFKRDGTGVATPVWFVSEERLLIERYKISYRLVMLFYRARAPFPRSAQRRRRRRAGAHARLALSASGRSHYLVTASVTVC